jgi:release factor glutamine methyltransferase
LIEGGGELVTARAGHRLLDMIERRRSGEPLQYVCGSWGFRRLDLLVDHRVLIPRPETEVVVEAALDELARLRASCPEDRPLVAVDLGTGSGAIALALADEAPARAGEVDIWATDSSPSALQVASANLAGLAGAAAPRVRLVEGEWWTALPADLAGRVDLVVSNPPYVAAADEVEAQVSEWEPAAALWSGPTGLEATGAILAGAGRWLAPVAALVLEMAAERSEATRRLAERHGFRVGLRDDLSGRPRVLVARGGGAGRVTEAGGPADADRPGV